jgi:hypothetical protein
MTAPTAGLGFSGSVVAGVFVAVAASDPTEGPDAAEPDAAAPPVSAGVCFEPCFAAATFARISAWRSFLLFGFSGAACAGGVPAPGAVFGSAGGVAEVVATGAGAGATTSGI